jgi:hypothetical protein
VARERVIRGHPKSGVFRHKDRIGDDAGNLYFIKIARRCDMEAKIIAVVKSKGFLATHWEFDFTIGNNGGKAVEGTMSLSEAIAFANRRDLGPVAEMCRAIKATPPPELSWLVGRIFKDPA